MRGHIIYITREVIIFIQSNASNVRNEKETEREREREKESMRGED